MNLCNDYAKMSENIVQEAVKYLRLYPNIEALILGISGGIDSAVTAALAKEVCNRMPDCRLIGVSIPIISNKRSERKIAKQVGKAFCDEFKEVKYISKLFRIFRLKAGKIARIMAFQKVDDDSIEEKIKLGNIKARLRMIYLYDKAYKNKGLVLSTDNLSEYNLGFWTLHGDVGDLGLIQELWKTEVYGIAHYLRDMYKNHTRNKKASKALTLAIDATPTDGLGITDSDFDQIGVDSYEEVDDLLIKYIITEDKKLEKHPVIKRHLKYAFKRKNPYGIARELIIPKSLEDLV